VLGTAYYRARRRNKDLGTVVLMVGIAVFLFVVAAVVPRPPMTVEIASVLVVGSILLIGGAMGVVLWRGFRD
jgi:uncharacterized membrane protein HdeD (DUF308 family)